MNRMIFLIVLVMVFAGLTAGCHTEADLGTVVTDESPERCVTDETCGVAQICAEGYYSDLEGKRCTPFCVLEYTQDIHGVVQDELAEVSACPEEYTCVVLDPEDQEEHSETLGLSESELLGQCEKISHLPRGWGNAVEDGDIPDGDEPEDGDELEDGDIPDGDEPEDGDVPDTQDPGTPIELPEEYAIEVCWDAIPAGYYGSLVFDSCESAGYTQWQDADGAYSHMGNCVAWFVDADACPSGNFKVALTNGSAWIGESKKPLSVAFNEVLGTVGEYDLGWYLQPVAPGGE